MQRLVLALTFITSVYVGPLTQAQTLDLTLLDPNQTVTQGTRSVVFDATILNPSTTDTIYLNGASASTASSLLTVDVSPFFANAPFSLAPGQSSGPFEMFAVNLGTTASAGRYADNGFQIQGGADGGTFSAFNDLADVNFSVTVTRDPVTAPEMDPASAMSGLIMLMGGLAVWRGRRSCPSGKINS